MWVALRAGIWFIGSVRFVTRLTAPIVMLLAGACAGELADPTIYDDPEICGLDVREDILIPRCGRSTCHRPGSAPYGLEYVTFGLDDRLVGVPASDCPEQLLIDPDNPDASHILVRVSDTPMCGDEPVGRMPQTGAPLDEREMACLRAWVHEMAGGQQP